MIVILLWALSPLGSQMSLRLLVLTDADVVSQADVRYFNTSLATSWEWYFDHDTSAFAYDDILDKNGAVVRSLIGASMLTSKDILDSPMDQWGNVKVPHVNAHDLDAGPDRSTWITVNSSSDRTWVSLSGLMVAGLPALGNSTFIFETAYIEATCADHMQVSVHKEGDMTASLKSMGFGDLQVHHNLSAAFASSEKVQSKTGIDSIKSSTLFLDTLSKAPSASQFFDTISQNMVYVSRAWSMATFDYSNQKPRYPFYDLYNCTLTYPRIQGNISCISHSCSVDQVRRSPENAKWQSQPPFADSEFRAMLEFIPGVLGYPNPGNISIIDQYLLGADLPMSYGLNPIRDGFEGFSGAEFGKRITTLLNTVWQASLAPHNIGLGASALDEARSQAGGSPVGVDGIIPNATTNATVHLTLPHARYRANRWHAALLLLITLILQLCAIASLVLAAKTSAPDILGFVSTLTRDNPHTAVPAGGSAMDGAERARALAGLKVQLADVWPYDEQGYVAFRSVADGADPTFGSLGRKRLYQ